MGQVFENKKVAFYTLGCKLNFSETSSIGRSLIEKGFERVRFGETADLVVINTCTVTELAEKKGRQAIQKAVKRNPGAFVAVMGCYAQLKPDDIANISGVDVVLGANEKFKLHQYLDNLEKAKRVKVFANEINRHKKEFYPSFSHTDRTRCFLKIQDGCDYFCTFCTIPFARGRSRSGSIEQTLATARLALDQGAKELVLTGVNIGEYGKGTDENFLMLLKALDKMEGDFRIRIGSVEPNLLNNNIINFVADSNRIVPHFHVPLQAGSDEVLFKMKRKYDTTLFLDRMSKIRELFPDAFIGVDVITGMNGESEANFDETIEFIKGISLSQLHVFTYSERPATQALNIQGKVKPEEKKRRSQVLHNLSDKKTRAFYTANIGKTKPVLFEALELDGKMFGFTDNYIKVEAPFEKGWVNTVKYVELGEFSEEHDALTAILIHEKA